MRRHGAPGAIARPVRRGCGGRPGKADRHGATTGGRGAGDFQNPRQGRGGPGDIMASMATDTASSIVPASAGTTSSWGLGDGQAIPWEYAPAPESRDIVTIQERYGLFIGGRFVPAEGGGTFATVNPATEETMAQVAKGTPADADR